MDHPNTEQILTQIRNLAHLLEGRGKTTAVFPIIKDILLRSIVAVPVNTKLPPIRVIADTLTLTPVPVQRAINELVKDGVLSSKFKSGVFVRENIPPQAQAIPAMSSFNKDFHERIIFATESYQPFQRQFWSSIGTAFTHDTPSNQVEITHFVYEESEPETFDLLEITQWDKHSPDWGNQFIDMRDVNLGFPDNSFKYQTTPFWLPLYYRTHFLFYNRALLQKHGIPEPRYTDLDGQLAYCELTNTVADKCGFTSKPHMTYYPITILGHDAGYFIRSLKSPEDSNALQKLKTALEKIKRFYDSSSFSSDYNGTGDGFDKHHKAFLTGNNPFYWGSSVDYWRFNTENPGLDWCVYPFFNADGGFYKTPVYGAIRGNTPRPIECFRFLEFLLLPEIQKKFIATGALSGDDSLNRLPRFAGDNDWLQEKLRQSAPVDFKHGEEFYLENNILNAEIWRAVIGEVSWEKALDNAFKYGQYYIHRNGHNGK